MSQKLTSADHLVSISIADLHHEFDLSINELSVRIYQSTQCLKITEKISFNIASEASYVFLSEFIKVPEVVNFDEFLKT